MPQAPSPWASHTTCSQPKRNANAWLAACPSRWMRARRQWPNLLPQTPLKPPINPMRIPTRRQITADLGPTKLNARHNSPRQRPLRPALGQGEHPLIHLGPLELTRLPLLKRGMNLALINIQPTRQSTQRQLGVARPLGTTFV